MFEQDQIYHIYNRANGNENLFREAKNYSFFLRKYHHHTHAVAETFAFCLMSNHFHAMVRIRTAIDTRELVPEGTLERYKTHAKFVSKQFSNFFSSYSQAYNKEYKRHGSLFQPNMKRKAVDNDAYLTRLVVYIHMNPVKHGFKKTPWDWPYSSIHGILLTPSKGKGLFDFFAADILRSTRETVISWFGNVDEFRKAHSSNDCFNMDLDDEEHLSTSYPDDISNYTL